MFINIDLFQNGNQFKYSFMFISISFSRLICLSVIQNNPLLLMRLEKLISMQIKQYLKY